MASFMQFVEKKRTQDILFFDGIHIPSVKELFTPGGKLKPVGSVRKQPKIKLKAIPPPKKDKPIIEKVILKPKPEFEHKSVFIKQPDDELPKDWVRPKAEYTNIGSPYGIATEMLLEQIREEKSKKIS